MMKLTKIIVLLCLIFIVGCSEDDQIATNVSSIETSYNSSEKAVTNGVGTFDLQFKNNDGMLTVQLVGPVGSGSELTTGTYVFNRDKNMEYSITPGENVSYWVDGSSDKLHVITSGKVTVVTENGKSLLIGKLYDRNNNVFSFEAKDISFNELNIKDVTFSKVLDARYGVVYGQGLYRMIIANEDESIVASLDFYNGPSKNANIPVMPSGQYFGANSGIHSSLFMNVSYWLDVKNNVKHELASASCNIVDGISATKINGVLTDKQGNSIRMIFDDKIKFNTSQGNQDIYTSLMGNWRMISSEWMVYDTVAKQWVFQTEPDNNTNCEMSWVGIPDYSRFYVSGLWSASSGMYFRTDNAGGFSIPFGYSANPSFVARTTSDEYVMFPTFYDPTSGYFLSGGAYTLALNDDQTTFTGNKIVMTDDNGEEIIFEYFGVMGYGLSTGKYAFFSNWSFSKVPSFTKIANPSALSSVVKSNSIAGINNSLSNNAVDSEIIMIKADNIPTVKAESVMPYTINR